MSLRDRKAGVRFTFPHHVDPQSKPSHDPGVEARTYQDQVDQVGLSVTVVRSGAGFPPSYPRSVYDQMISALNQQGAVDAHLTSVKKSTVAKGQALDASLSFTATDGSLNYWRMRTITAGHIVVQLQALTFSDPGDAEPPKHVDAMFAELANSVVLD